MRDIWLYSFENWGVEAADNYVRRIEDHLYRLRDEPARARTMERVPERFRYLRVGSHFAFVSFVGSEIRVVRVLHKRMDPRRHLT